MSRITSYNVCYTKLLRARAGGKHGNKGVEAAVAVLKMLKLKFNLIDEFDLESFGVEDIDD